MASTSESDDEFVEGEVENESEDEYETDKSRRGVQMTRNLRHHPDLVAVRIIRAFRSVKMRQNKWRPIYHNLTGDNIDIDACIADGSHGVVFRAENRDTRIKGKTGRQYAIKVADFRLMTESREIELPELMGSDHTPTLTQSSEALIMEREEMLRRSLYAKRTNEMKTSLRYIKEGHRNVCNLEGFGEFDILANRYFLYILELCDLGTLHDMVVRFKQLSEYIPEGFMWHAFDQLLDGLTFLHGEHPDYKDNERSRGKDSAVIARDIKPNNIFLQTSPQADTYPIVKLADFGEAIHLPLGGSRDFAFGNTVSEPPDDKMSAKYDVFSVGVQIYFMATNGLYPDAGCEMHKLGWPIYGDATRQERRMMTAARSDPKRFRPISDHLTLNLYQALRWVLNVDRHKRPSALEAWRRIKSMNEERKKLMYRPLPSWVGLAFNQKFGTLELTKLEWRMQQAEDDGFIFEYAGNIPFARKKAEREPILKCLEKEKRDAQAMKEARLREFNLKSGEDRRKWVLAGYRKEAENLEIEKIEQERKRFGGFLEPTVKRRKLGPGKLYLT